MSGNECVNVDHLDHPSCKYKTEKQARFAGDASLSSHWCLILGSIVVSIPACHAGDRGSIPRLGEFFNSFGLDANVSIMLFFHIFWRMNVLTDQSDMRLGMISK